MANYFAQYGQSYNATAEQKRIVSEDTFQILNDFDIKHNVDPVNTMLSRFWIAKGQPLNVLSQHPNFDPENLMIRLEEFYDLKPDMAKIRRFFDWVDTQLRKKFRENESRHPETGKNWDEAYNNQLKIAKEIQDQREKWDGESLKWVHGYPSSALKLRRHKALKEAFWFIENTTSSDDMLGARFDYEYERYIHKTFDLIPILRSFSKRFLDEDICEEINRAFPEAGAVPGKKTVKVIRKLCQIWGIDSVVDVKEISWVDNNGIVRSREKDIGFKGQIAAYGDAINPIRVTRPTFISCNPVDYLMMSTNTVGGWHSCYQIPNGEYCSGTIGYMLDSTTVIFYALRDKEDFQGEIEKPQFEEKFYRCAISMDENKILQSRVYPSDSDGDTGLYDEIRNIVQTVIAECLKVNNTWTIKKGISNCMQYCREHSENTGYMDWKNNSQCNISILKNGAENEESILISSQPIDIRTGHWHDSHEFYGGKMYECNNCNADIDEDDFDLLLIDDFAFCCHDCAYNYGFVCTEDAGWKDREYCLRCDDDDEWYYYTDGFVETVDGYHYRNEDVAIDHGYRFVERLDEWHPKDDCVETANEKWELEEDCEFCRECGEWVYWDNWDSGCECCIQCVAHKESEEQNQESKTDSDPLLAKEEGAVIITSLGWEVAALFRPGEATECRLVQPDTGEILSRKDTKTFLDREWLGGRLSYSDREILSKYFEIDVNAEEDYLPQSA